MKIISDPSRDGRSRKTSSGAYEWWYFDGMSDDGVHAFVIIFYDGNPFSKHYIMASEEGRAIASDHPALSVSVYRHGRPVYYSFTEYHPADVRWGPLSGGVGTVSCDMAGQRFWQTEADPAGYRIDIDQTLESGDRLRAGLTFKASGSRPLFRQPHDGGDLEGEGHAWNLVLARARVSGRLQIDRPGDESMIIDPAGDGYHDHNMGSEPMKDAFRDWHWGRFHGPEGEMVHYVMQGLDGAIQLGAWLILDGVRHEARTFTPGGRTLSRFGLLRYEPLRFQFGEGLDAVVDARRCVDDGPFYQRFMARLTIRRSGSGRLVWTGISEYIRPSRIHKRRFWPLVDMRIRYMSHPPHWVQRIPELYRATW